LVPPLFGTKLRPWLPDSLAVLKGLLLRVGTRQGNGEAEGRREGKGKVKEKVGERKWREEFRSPKNFGVAPGPLSFHPPSAVLVSCCLHFFLQVSFVFSKYSLVLLLLYGPPVSTVVVPVWRFCYQFCCFASTFNTVIIVCWVNARYGFWKTASPILMKFDTTDVQNLCIFSQLTFKKSKSKFKVKTAVLKSYNRSSSAVVQDIFTTLGNPARAYQN